ncbi:MAG: DNA-directed RNA polymerase subunit omega, partial [Actinobacteria bacterium]|nr:DNA-directed RNA polymerase subunit omega [Actinomycetota bacterium]
MMTPAIEKLMSRTKSKFLLVTLAARRAREITQQDDNMQIGSWVSKCSSEFITLYNDSVQLIWISKQLMGLF